jgi:hypothetical protein
MKEITFRIKEKRNNSNDKFIKYFPNISLD